MSYFAVDDQFTVHPKFHALLDTDRPDRDHTRFVALSLWLAAGVECRRRKNGGLVTLHMARTLLGVSGKQAEAACLRLVGCGLWVKSGDVFAFHDWDDHQARGRKVSRQDHGADLAIISPGSRQDLAIISPTVSNDSVDLDAPSQFPIPNSQLHTEGPVSAKERNAQERARMAAAIAADSPAPTGDVAPLPKPAVADDLAQYIVRAFRDRWEREFNAVWADHQHNPHPDTPARLIRGLCERNGVEDPKPIVDDLIAVYFEQPWAAEKQFPWRFFAQDPVRFIPAHVLRKVAK